LTAVTAGPRVAEVYLLGRPRTGEVRLDPAAPRQLGPSPADAHDLPAVAEQTLRDGVPYTGADAGDECGPGRDPSWYQSAGTRTYLIVCRW
jgi:hypothetical protein